MLRHLQVDISDEGTVNLTITFESMKCRGWEFSLVEAVAPHWREMARTLGVDERLVVDDRDKAKKHTYNVLTKLFENGYKGSITWEGVIAALEDAGLKKTAHRLREALKCIIKE